MAEEKAQIWVKEQGVWRKTFSKILIMIFKLALLLILIGLLFKLGGLWSGVLGLAFGLFASIFTLISLARAIYVPQISAPEGYNLWDYSFKYALSCLLGINGIYTIVDDGKVMVVRPRGIFARSETPNTVVITDGNAVVFEYGGHFSRVTGPGVVATKPFELIKAVVDLRPQWSMIEAEAVFTRDRVPLRIELGLGYQIIPQKLANVSCIMEESIKLDQQAEVIGGSYPVYAETVRKAVYNASAVGWQRTIEGAADSILRDVISTYNLNELTIAPASQDVSVISAIEAEVRERLQHTSLSLGVNIGAVYIQNIEMPMTVTEQMLDRWRAEWEGHIEAIRAENAKRILTIRAQAEAEAWESIQWTKMKLITRFIGYVKSPELASQIIQLTLPTSISRDEEAIKVSKFESQLSAIETELNLLSRSFQEETQELKERVRGRFELTERKVESLENEIKTLKEDLRSKESRLLERRTLMWNIVFGLVGAILTLLGLNWKEIIGFVGSLIK